MRVLLSIKPKFAELIFNGSKKFEFRRTIFKNKNIKTVVVYASSPMQKVIGEFDIDLIINENIDVLWDLTKDGAGIEKDYFYEYFSERIKGYAIKIKMVKRYDEPLSLKNDFKINPPQSFVYI